MPVRYFNVIASVNNSDSDYFDLMYSNHKSLFIISSLHQFEV